MSKSKVFWTDFRTIPFGDGIVEKFKKLLKKAGIEDIDFDGKFVAIKMHFGELGNLAFLRPNYARAIVDIVKARGGKPFLTDCNTMYPGSRKNAIEHLECAWLNGFTPYTVGCPVIIADGLKGLDEELVPVDGEYVKEAKIGKAIMDADIFISLSHFKGHEMTGFGGAIKNIGMGGGSRRGKCEQHSSGKPHIIEANCRGCTSCLKECANGGLVFDSARKKMTVDKNNCVGCGRCLGSCNFDAIEFDNDLANAELNCKMAEYTKAIVQNRPTFHISVICDVSPNCDCHGENDTPIISDIGIFASFDPLALDRCCVDMCLKAEPLPHTHYTDMIEKHHADKEKDLWTKNNPGSEWETCLKHASKIGLGNLEYELIKV